jgi:hypothetical protein
MMSKTERAAIVCMLHFILLCVTHALFSDIQWTILLVVSPVGMHFVYRSIFRTKE